MKRNHILFLREILFTQFNHWSLFPLFAMVVGTASVFLGVEMMPGFYLWPLLGLLPICFFFLRNYIKNLFLLLISQAVFVGLIWLLPAPQLCLKVPYMVTAAFYFVYSVSRWLLANTPEDGTLAVPVTVAMSVAAMFMLNYQNLEGWNSYFILALVLSLGLFLIAYYVTQYLNFLIVNDSSAGHLPEKEMFVSGMGMVCGYTLIGMLVLILSTNIAWLQPVISAFRQLFVWFFRFLAFLLPAGEEGSEIPQEIPADQGAAEMLPYMEESEPSLLAIILERVLLIAVLLFLGYLIFLLLRSVVRFIRNHLAVRMGIRENEDPLSTIDVREKCSVQRRNPLHRGERFSLFPTPEKRIRQLFRKKVLSSRTQLVPSGEFDTLKVMTASDCGQILQAKDMAQLYERARYSDQPCTGEEVRRMKEACR